MKKAIRARMEMEERAMRRKLFSRIFSLDIFLPPGLFLRLGNRIHADQPLLGEQFLSRRAQDIIEEILGRTRRVGLKDTPERTDNFITMVLDIFDVGFDSINLEGLYPVIHQSQGNLADGI